MNRNEGVIMTEEYFPKIIGFYCRWRSYAGAGKGET